MVTDRVIYPSLFYKKENRVIPKLILTELIFGGLIAGALAFIILTGRGVFVDPLEGKTILLVFSYLFYALCILTLIFGTVFMLVYLLYAVVQFIPKSRKIKQFVDDYNYFALINLIKQRVRSTSIIFNVVFNHSRCAIAALSVFDEKNVEEALLSFYRHEPTHKKAAKKSLLVLAIRKDFASLEEYITYLDARREEHLKK